VERLREIHNGDASRHRRIAMIEDIRRCVDVRFQTVIGKTEGRRQHPNDRFCCSVNGDRAANDMGISLELASPKTVAENDQWRSAWPILHLGEDPTKLRRYS